jgi:secreted PhoX family phosphatase
VKRTALGRLKHENACFAEGRDGQAVVYTGDDERGEFLYKFVSERDWRHLRRRGTSPLDRGTLHVARFDADGTGHWLPLVHGSAGLTAADGFVDQADVLIRARAAARAVGGTRMDRPEWVAVSPCDGEVAGTFTNNSQRGSAYPTDAANPRGPNPWGHIIRWREHRGDHAATSFRWEVFVLAGDPANAAHGATPGIDAFGSPDGLWYDDDGRMWIQTDGSQPIACNNQMLVADPRTRRIERFLVGPKGCEITGITATPDRSTVFVNVQHPGEGGTAANPTAVSSWPDGGLPRSATIAIRRIDGRPVG